MRLVVSAGGTGGHVYPALAVVEHLLDARAQNASMPTLAAADLLWIGSQGGMEEDLVRRAVIPYIGLAAGGLRGKGVLERVRNTARIATSVGKARGILARFKAAAVFVTGGYACVSVTLAAWIQRIPVLIYLPDIVPGLAVRFLSRLATRVAVTSEESCQHLPPGKAVVTGYPVRYDIFVLDRVQARRALGLDEEEKMLLVFGGSRGAKSMNRALVSGLPELLPICQILHISGRLDANWVADATEHLPDRLRARYHHHAYLHDMPKALRAADLAVARAGAATLGEFPAAGLPSVLVPYPHSGQHQDPNAEYMARNGASRVLADAHLADNLVPTIIELLGDDKALAKMREAAEAMARPEAAQAIAQQLWQVGQHCAMAQLGAQT
jgi:UDP-N-acetylglucosamine--N-acetylmuramyl-(pentapeptide) pyrophosphoryl-undecaprenol N-acetylglucosamine transferase